MDIDIYGDLCADLPTPSPGALASPAPLPSDVEVIAIDAAPPRLQPPPGLPPGPPVVLIAAHGSPRPASPPRLGYGTMDGGSSSPVASSGGPQTWVAPGYEHLAAGIGSVTSVIIEAGEVIAGSMDAAAEQATAAGRPVEVDSDDDVLEPELLAVASTTERKPRKRDSSRAATGLELAIPNAQPLPLAGADPTSSCEQFLLLGGLPLTLPHGELQRLAGKFGALNAISGGVVEENGRPAGIALLEYSTAARASRAAQGGSGICSLPAWPIMTAPPPKLVLVGRELLGMMRAGGPPPWPEGGACSDDLRCVLFRQFERYGLYLRRSDASPTRQLARQNSAGTLSLRSRSQGDSPERPPAPRREEGWADKLQALKRKVNGKQDLGDVKRIRG